MDYGSPLFKIERPLMVELATNDHDLALASQEGGADAIIFSVSNQHVSQNSTREIDLEEESIRKGLEGIHISKGISLGNNKAITRDEWSKLVDLHIDFIVAHPSLVPPFIMEDERLDKFVYAPSGLPMELYITISNINGVSGLIFLPQSQIDGSVPFNLIDVIWLNALTKSIAKPILFKIAYNIIPDDLQILNQSGSHGYVLDPYIGGSLEPDGYNQTVKAFKDRLVILNSRKGYPGLS